MTNLLNEQLPIQTNLNWLENFHAKLDRLLIQQPLNLMFEGCYEESQLTAYDFPEKQSFGGQGGDEPNYRED